MEILSDLIMLCLLCNGAVNSNSCVYYWLRDIHNQWAGGYQTAQRQEALSIKAALISFPADCLQQALSERNVKFMPFCVYG